VDKAAFAALLIRAMWLIVALVSGRYDYAVARRALAAQEASMSFAKDIQMTADETVVDNFLDFLVSSETERLNNLGLFPPALYFTKAQQVIKSSALFPFIRSMPKGGNLHVHDGALGDRIRILNK
jgi:hypothetical protein